MPSDRRGGTARRDDAGADVDGPGPASASPRSPLGGPGEAGPASPRGDRLSWLRAQGLGVCCGLATVVLLAAGSIVIPLTRDGASQDLAFDEIRPFFTSPSATHLWFYLLIPVLGLFALNAVLATWHHVLRKWRAGQRGPSAYAPAVIHLSFLAALLAHLVGGLFNHETGRVVVGPTPAPLGDGRLARTVSVDVDRLPGGMPKTVRAVLEVTPAGGGAPTRHVVGYNQPLSRNLGTDLHLLQDLGRVEGAARLQSGDLECEATVGESCQLGRVRVWLRALEHPAPGTDMVLARLAVERAGADADVGARGAPPEGAAVTEHRLMPGGAILLADQTPLRLASIEPRPAVALRGRHAAGNPWALAAAVLLGLGVLLMGRRFFAT